MCALRPSLAKGENGGGKEVKATEKSSCQSKIRRQYPKLGLRRGLKFPDMAVYLLQKRLSYTEEWIKKNSQKV